jgi:DNA-binding NarL/FixJ family response regulator
VGEAAAPAAGRVALHVVGREAERQRLDAFATALVQGARALVIRGEPGIGKTTLWRDAVERCRGRGFEVLLTRPAEEEMPLALVGLVDLFEHAGSEVETPAPGDDPITRGRSVLEALRRLAERAPVVVAIDDLQWLDLASARALRYSVRRLDAEPVGVLATASAGTEKVDPLATERGLPPGRHEELELGPLGLGALRRLLAGTVSAISRPLLRRIHELSGGNPLYAIELARALASDGRARDATGARLPLPDSLQTAISHRLGTVPPEVVPLLETASALGPASLQELSDALGGTDVSEALAVAERHGLLVVEGRQGVRFSHALIGSAVYRRLGPPARRSLHGRLAGLAADLDVRARHLALSTDEPDAGIATLLEEAATRAHEQGAPDLAAELSRHSLRLTPAADEPAAQRRALTRIESLAAAGEVSRARRLADELAAALPPGPARAEVLVRRADLEDDDRETAEALLVGALEEAGDDLRLRGRVLHHLARLRRLRSGDLAGAIECARAALELAEGAGDAALEGPAAGYLVHLETLAGRPRPELMARAVRLEEEVGGPPLSIGPRSLLAKHQLWAGDLGSARALLEAVHVAAVRSGEEIKRPQHFYDLTVVECAAGNLAAAEELAHEGIEAARDADNTYAERELLYPLALVQAWLGRSDEARTTAGRLHDEAVRYGVRPLVVRAQSVRGLLALSERQAEAAAGELAEAARLLEEMGFRNPGAFPVLPDAVEALALAGDTDAARGLLGRLEDEAAAAEGDWAPAAALRARGVLLLADGRPEDAAVALEASAAAFERLGFRPDAARAVLARGRALLRRGRRGLAAEALEDARGRFAGMGAVLWAARVAEELERVSRGRAAGELTAAEGRVAALVGEGLKNREIGWALFMSVGTVEAHLTRIYRKLGIRSRSDLARLVADGTVQVSGDGS